MAVQTNEHRVQCTWHWAQQRVLERERDVGAQMRETERERERPRDGEVVCSRDKEDQDVRFHHRSFQVVDRNIYFLPPLPTCFFCLSLLSSSLSFSHACRACVLALARRDAAGGQLAICMNRREEKPSQSETGRGRKGSKSIMRRKVSAEFQSSGLK